MGFEAPITAELPQADVRPVAHVLVHWYICDPDQHMLARFGIDHIRSRLRSWAPYLADGLAAEMRWIGFGCLFEFVYGFVGGQEFWIVTKLRAQDCGPAVDIVSQSHILAMCPDKKQFVRLPGLADRTINRLMFGTPVSDVTVAVAGRAGLMPYFEQSAAGRIAMRYCFAPPWLPATYLASQIPKLFPPQIVLERRHPAGNEREFEMKYYMQLNRSSSLLLRGIHPAARRIHDFASTPAATRFVSDAHPVVVSGEHPVRAVRRTGVVSLPCLPGNVSGFRPVGGQASIC